MELCFGKYDYDRHIFTLNYKLTNFIFNTDDSQLIYYRFIDELSNVDFNNFSIDISSYYKFPDTLDVWGYGYKGYAYVSNGKIGMSNEEDTDMNDMYVVLLAKFPLGTFDTINSFSYFNTFDDVYNMAQDGSFEYDYSFEFSEEDDESFDFLGFAGVSILFFTMILCSSPLLIILAVYFIIKATDNSGYGYKDNKKVDIRNIPMFRDIPCNKDIYYANALFKLNNMGDNESNIFGAIILKWVRDDKISFRNEKTGIFNRDTSIIDLTKNVTFDNELENKLFTMMRAASKDGLLEAKEFERWCSYNYEEFLGLFTKMVNKVIYDLKVNKHIYRRTNKEECKMKNVMDDKIYNDSVELYGLRKYLSEFSRMDTKEVMEVKLWDEYLMFAYLFGIADKVAKQLKDMYPEVVMEMQRQNFDYDTLIFVNNISTRSVSAASSARQAAQSYSSGGGGFSSGGGGGGSFGGGGGGSR